MAFQFEVVAADGPHFPDAANVAVNTANLGVDTPDIGNDEVKGLSHVADIDTPEIHVDKVETIPDLEEFPIQGKMPGCRFKQSFEHLISLDAFAGGSLSKGANEVNCKPTCVPQHPRAPTRLRPPAKLAIPPGSLSPAIFTKREPRSGGAAGVLAGRLPTAPRSDRSPIACR
jgi:hypothetical protein